MSRGGDEVGLGLIGDEGDAVAGRRRGEGESVLDGATRLFFAEDQLKPPSPSR